MRKRYYAIQGVQPYWLEVVSQPIMIAIKRIPSPAHMHLTNPWMFKLPLRLPVIHSCCALSLQARADLKDKPWVASKSGRDEFTTLTTIVVSMLRGIFLSSLLIVAKIADVGWPDRRADSLTNWLRIRSLRIGYQHFYTVAPFVSTMKLSVALLIMAQPWLCRSEMLVAEQYLW